MRICVKKILLIIVFLFSAEEGLTDFKTRCVAEIGDKIRFDIFHFEPQNEQASLYATVEEKTIQSSAAMVDGKLAIDFKNRLIGELKAFHMICRNNGGNQIAVVATSSFSQLSQAEASSFEIAVNQGLDDEDTKTVSIEWEDVFEKSNIGFPEKNPAFTKALMKRAALPIHLYVLNAKDEGILGLIAIEQYHRHHRTALSYPLAVLNPKVTDQTIMIRWREASPIQPFSLYREDSEQLLLGHETDTINGQTKDFEDRFLNNTAPLGLTGVYTWGSKENEATLIALLDRFKSTQPPGFKTDLVLVELTNGVAASSDFWK